jgi:SAM-dependent methyltransferase
LIMRFSLFKKAPTPTNFAEKSLTRDDVIAAYRWILGREPESEKAIRSAQRGYTSVAQLRQGILRSGEFTAGLAPSVKAFRPYDLDLGELPIEVSCDSQVMPKLLAHIERVWTQLGEADPYWSVLSVDRFQAGSFWENEEAFWESGKDILARFQRWLQRNRIALPANASCLEYGCGTGRITRWLSQEFASLVACDISEAHLKLAAEAIPAERRERVTFFRISHIGRLEELPPFDVLFSTIVLQHNPPPIIAYILDKLLAGLRPGGIAYFQVPTLFPGYRFVLAEYLSSTVGTENGMEMHVLPQRHVFEIAARNRCEPIEVLPDDWTASWPYVSHTFLLRKRAE